MTDDKRTGMDAGDAVREGVRSVIGILGALREALEDTVEDLREKGELSPDRAREAARTTLRKAQDAVDDVRERLDFVPRREFDALREEVGELRRRLEEMRDPAAPLRPPAVPPADSGPVDEARGGDPGEEKPDFPVEVE